MEYLNKKAYAENIKAAEYYLSLAESSREGQRWNIISVIIYSAFAIEAYLNHAGISLRDNEWDSWDAENHPSPEQKLESLDVQLETEEAASFTELFQLRNMVAHGRSNVVFKSVRKPQNNIVGAMNNLSSEFEARTTLKKTKKLHKGARKIISQINESTLKSGSVELWNIGNGSLRTS
ncbi:hypothetical protein ACMXYR_08210 [Neptuniibacter sp. QD29_5]|uniref:hypothetical protein n=1 Tax=Neptuniibacter sp. QD29_5 TaxID=3398207 RepID=UPI0039F5B557